MIRRENSKIPWIKIITFRSLKFIFINFRQTKISFTFKLLMNLIKAKRNILNHQQKMYTLVPPRRSAFRNGSYISEVTSERGHVNNSGPYFES